jgi:hypothetical protein
VQSFFYCLGILRVRLLSKLLCVLRDASVDINALYRLRHLLYIESPRWDRANLDGTDDRRMARLDSYYVILAALFVARTTAAWARGR